MRMVLWALVIALAITSVRPQPVIAQVTKAAMGTAVGVGGGALITMSLVVARAKFQGEYLESVEDLIHWQSAPMLITPGVGMFFGLGGRKPLEASVLGSVSGMLVGTAVGAGIGWLVSASPEAPWAGGVMGAGAGMTIGGLALGTRAWLRSRQTDDGGSEIPLLEIRIPL